MTQEEINDKYAAIEAKEKALLNEADELESELKNLEDLKNISKIKKAELKREVEIRRRLSEIDDELDKVQDEYDALEAETQKLREEEEQERKAKASKTRGKVLRGVAIVLALAAAFAVGKCSKDKKCSTNGLNTDKSISYSTKMPEVSDTITVTATPVPTVVPGLVGDVTDDKQVATAANGIMTNSISGIIKAENDPQYTALATSENIEDIIRVVNGELPKYSAYDDFTIVETVNNMSDIFVNRGLGNVAYSVNLSDLYPKGSKEAEYIATYDEIFNQIKKYKDEGNVDGVIQLVGFYGTKLYNEWHLAGLYGGYNPYLFPEEEQYFLLQCATCRFPNYIREYLDSNDLTVCVPTCYNPETQEYKLVEVRDIFEALYMGTSKNGEISVLRSGEVINVFGETYQDLKHVLDKKAGVKTEKLG